jgi:hypothetical protein
VVWAVERRQRCLVEGVNVRGGGGGGCRRVGCRQCRWDAESAEEERMEVGERGSGNGIYVRPPPLLAIPIPLGGDWNPLIPGHGSELVLQLIIRRSNLGTRSPPARLVVEEDMVQEILYLYRRQA